MSHPDWHHRYRPMDQQCQANYRNNCIFSAPPFLDYSELNKIRAQQNQAVSIRSLKKSSILAAYVFNRSCNWTEAVSLIRCTAIPCSIKSKSICVSNSSSMTVDTDSLFGKVYGEFIPTGLFCTHFFHLGNGVQ